MRKFAIFLEKMAHSVVLKAQHLCPFHSVSFSSKIPDILDKAGRILREIEIKDFDILVSLNREEQIRENTG